MRAMYFQSIPVYIELMTLCRAERDVSHFSTKFNVMDELEKISL